MIWWPATSSTPGGTGGSSSCWPRRPSSPRSARCCRAPGLGAETPGRPCGPPGPLVGLLAWFKYYGFLAVNVDNALHPSAGRPLPLLHITLPVAISFFTFMAISYVVDIYRGVLEAGPRHRHRGLPVVLPPPGGRSHRAGHRAPAPDPPPAGPSDVDYVEACWLIMAGLAKKVVLSSYLATYVVDPVFADPRPALCPRGPLRHLRLRRPDLRRLQRLHRHRHRSRPALGLPVPPELQTALHRRLDCRTSGGVGT